MITKEIALSLEYRATLYHVREKNSDGSPVRCRVNGKCKTWVTRPNDFQLPVKHGLKHCFYITPRNAADWSEGEGYVWVPEPDTENLTAENTVGKHEEETK